MPKKKRLTKAEKDDVFKINRRILKHHFRNRKEIIGLDLGTHIKGLYNNKFGSQIWSGGGDPNIYARISIIKKEFLVYLSFKNSKKCFFLIEDYAFSRSKMVQTAELGGIIRVLLYESGIPYLTIAPNTLKKFVLGPSEHQKKGSQKAPVMVEVLDRWGIKFTDDNACDAYCIVKFMEYLRVYILGGEIDNRSLLKWEEQMFYDFAVNRGIPK